MQFYGRQQGTQFIVKVRSYASTLLFKGIDFGLYFLLMQLKAASLIAYDGDNEVNQDYPYYTYYYQKRLVKFFFLGTHIIATAYNKLTNKFEYTLINCSFCLNSMLTILCLKNDIPVDT